MVTAPTKGLSTRRGSRMSRSVPCSWMAQRAGRDLSRPSSRTCSAPSCPSHPQMSGPPAVTAGTTLGEKKPACSFHPSAGFQGPQAGPHCPPLPCCLGAAALTMVGTQECFPAPAQLLYSYHKIALSPPSTSVSQHRLCTV